jgi:colicin import membrane protein
MAAGLKVFRAHLGFYDTIVAATSQKKALQAWGASPSEFAKGFASVTDDPEAIDAARDRPGVVLRRPFGSKQPFSVEPAAPRIKTSPRAKADRQNRKRAAAISAQKVRDARRKEAKQELAAKLDALKEREQELVAEREAARADYRSRTKAL